MNKKDKILLSLMMFWQYLVWGAWYVTLGTYLGQGLSFTGPQIGISYSAFAIAAMLSPVFIGIIADRYFAAEKVLACLHIMGGMLLFLLSEQNNFSLFFVVIIFYALCYMPTIALTNNIALRQMHDPDRQFPGVRVLGTIGWIVVGWVVSLLNVEATNIPIIIAASISIVFGLSAFFLPHTPPEGGVGEDISLGRMLGLDALILLKKRSFAILVISSLLISIPLSFYYSFANLFLNEIGLSNTAGKMSFGQMSEIIFMILMPFFFRRFGVKGMILIAISAWGLRYLCFALGADTGIVDMLYVGILLHGISYDFFFVTGQIFVNNEAPAELKNSAQGLLMLATYGVGMFIGTWLSGQVVGFYTVVNETGQIHLWKQIWFFPIVIIVLAFILFSVYFKRQSSTN